jgi:hypothetical protein
MTAKKEAILILVALVTGFFATNAMEADTTCSQGVCVEVER